MKKIMRPIFTITILSVFFAISSLQAQLPTVKLYVPSMQIEEGIDSFFIPVKAEAFTSVTGMQFTLRWDSTVLEFMHMDTVNFGLKFLSNDNFGKPPYADGKGVLTFFWEDIEFKGRDLNDGDTILSLK